MSLQAEHQGRHFVKAVSPSLKKGINAFSTLTIKLLNIDKEYVAKNDSKFSEIRSAIEAAKQNLGEAESVALSELKAVDKCYEELLVRKGNLTSEQTRTKEKLQNLKSQQKNNKATLDMYRESQQTAKGQLREVQDELWFQRMHEQDAEDLRDAGHELTAIPIFGWIAGPLMVSAAEKDRENARFKAGELETTVQGFESQVQEFSSKVSECETNIVETRTEISDTEDEMWSIAWDIEEVLIQRKEIADFQEKMRNAVKVLGCLAGTSNVVELQTRSFVLLEAMIKLLQNFMKMVEGVKEDQLLQDEGLKALCSNLQVNYVKLKAITVPSDIAAIKDFI